MTPADFLTKWNAEAEAMRRRGILVNGATLCAEFLADFQQVQVTQGEALLNLTDAALESGYSADYLGRLIRIGTIPNAGRENAPRIRRRDLPRKATRLPPCEPGFKLLGASPGQIARAVVDSEKGAAR